MNTEQALTPREVAKRLGVTEYTIRRLVRAGRIPAWKLGRFWRVSEKVVNEIITGERKVGG